MSHNLRLLRLSATLGVKALFAWNTPGLLIVSLLVTPALQILFFVLMGKAFGYQSPSFFILGNAVQLAAAAGVTGLVSVVADERRFGTLSMIVGSPASRTAVMLGRMLPGVVIGAVVSLLSAVAGLLLAPQPVGARAVVLLVSAVLAAAFSSSAFGLFLSTLGLVYRDIFQIATAAYLVMLLVSGANIARPDLPGFLRWTGDALPQTHAIDAVRLAMRGAQDAGGSAPVAVLLEVIVGLVWLALALLGFRALEVQSRRSATLELY